MTDLVVGGGAVGTMIAWGLATGGRDVAIVRRRRDGAPGPAEIVVVEPSSERRAATITEIREPADLAIAPELIVFAVKMFDLEEAVASCDRWPAAPALTVSNGVGAEEIVATARPAGGLIAGSVTVSLEPAGDRAVARLNRGGIALASVRGDVTALTADVAGALARSGLRVRRLPDAAAMKWSKLVANLVGNASSAILDLPPAAIYGDPEAFAIERRQLLEALEVMQRRGLAPVALPGADVRLLALAARLPEVASRQVLRRVVGAARGGKDPSLRVHARSGSGPSEVGWLNGAVAREAERLGIPAPVNHRLTELVEETLADPARRAWFRERPDRLVAAVRQLD